MNDKYKIILHPDPRLGKSTSPVDVNSDALQTQIDMMFNTMYDAPGIGLAAPQIGIMNRVFVMDCAKDDNTGDPMVMINPEITWASEEISEYEEGCLSIPEIYAIIKRPSSIRLKFLDRDFKEQEEEFSELYATCAQHELDHLNGKLFIDYLSALKRQMITKKMHKLKKEMAII